MITDFIKKNVRVQPNKYTCGPCALRHALLAFGEHHSVKRIATLAHTTQPGTDIDQMTEAAKAFGYKLNHRRTHSPKVARGAIRVALAAGYPVIICVEAWTHWVTILDADDRHVVVADSSRPGPVLKRQTWRECLESMAVWRTEAVRFDLYVVAP